MQTFGKWDGIGTTLGGGALFPVPFPGNRTVEGGRTTTAVGGSTPTKVAPESLWGSLLVALSQRVKKITSTSPA